MKGLKMENKDKLQQITFREYFNACKRIYTFKYMWRKLKYMFRKNPDIIKMYRHQWGNETVFFPINR